MSDSTDHNAAANHAAELTTPQLEKRCARSAAKAGKFLASARAILEADLPYFLELRQRLNAQGQRRFDTEGWARWCDKHFSCDLRTVNRNLAALLGPEKERTKPRKWRPAAEAFVSAVEPAIRLARKHAEDPEAAEFLTSLEAEELDGLVPEVALRVPDFLDEMNRKKQVKKEEIYRMGLRLAQAVVDGSSAIRGETPEGKRILGVARHMLERKPDPPQDKPSRSAGRNFVVDEDDLMAAGATKDEREPKLKPGVFSMSWGGGYQEIEPFGDVAMLRPGGLVGIGNHVIGKSKGTGSRGWVFKVNSMTLSADYERIALNMWVIPHDEAAKEECGIYYEKQPPTKHILGDGGPLCMPKGTRRYGFSKKDYEYTKSGEKVIYGESLCIDCWRRNQDVVAENRKIMREVIGIIENIDKERADAFVAAMRKLIDSFTKKAKKPGGEKDDKVRKAHGSM